MIVVEEIRLNHSESLRITENGEGWLQVKYHQVGDGAGLQVGIGRTRDEALESSRATLQNALNVVDLAMLRRHA
jgi:hypothetical protein